MEKNRISIIEPNKDTRKFLETILAKDFELSIFETAMTALESLKKEVTDLILMETNLPVLNGFDACVKMKADEKLKSVPIILMAAKTGTSDIIKGLELGADDFVVKPFDYKELLARIKARLREKLTWKNEPRTIHIGDIKVVLDSREVYYFGRPVMLTSTEFDLLRILMENNGAIISRDEIIREVWKFDKNKARKRTIDVHVRSLRKKIPILQRNIMSIYGQGYKFEN